MKRAWDGTMALAGLLFVANDANAVIAAPSADGGAPVATAGDDAPVTCSETFTTGSERPVVTEKFPERGLSGHALLLEITVDHRKGEKVLPSGTASRSEGDALRALERAAFFLPDAKGGVIPTLTSEAKGERVTTLLEIPVVPLPPKPGRHELLLPPLPVAIARASGEVRTLCTKPHHVTVEDPTANTPDAKPRGNPKPERQLEEWTAAKNATVGALIALAVGALVALLVRAWRRRPKPIPPPPPPRPPWEVALEELFAVKSAGLVEQGRFAEHFDRVSDAVRRYLGARYGFDGLETTTEEALVALRSPQSALPRAEPFGLVRTPPPIAVLVDVEEFLRTADLVKFAKVSPVESECHAALSRAEDLVRRTMPLVEPRVVVAPPATSSLVGSKDGPGGGIKR